MGYYYSDKPKTDMKSIEKNENNNKDFNELNKLMRNDKKNQKNIIQKFNLDSSFKFLEINVIYLGFNSADDIYNKYKNEFKKRHLEKRDASHPSIFFNFGKGCGYYVDYLPDKGESKNAIFLYKDDYGARYCNKTIEEFIKHNDTLFIHLNAKNKLSFYDYFIKVCENDDWTKRAHNYEKHNCNHFVLKSLKILDVEFSKGNFEDNFIFTKEINKSKIEAIKDNTPSIFHSILHLDGYP